jgi:hypothetical protein
VDQRRDGWFGEGDDMIFVDHATTPTINGTGTEDYFNNAWCYHKPFSFPYYGLPLLEKRKDGGFYTMYRFHVPDPVRFTKHIRVSVEHVWGEATPKMDGGEGTNGYASVAYWYQQEPLRARAALPIGAANHPVLYMDLMNEHAPQDPLNVPAMEVELRRRGVDVKTVFVIGQEWLRGGGGLRIATKGSVVELPLRVGVAGVYRVEIQPINAWIETSTTIGVKNGRTSEIKKETLRRESDAAYRDLGTVKSADGTIVLMLAAKEVVGFQGLRVTKID